MTLLPDELSGRSRAVAAILEDWPTEGAAPSEQVRDSVVLIRTASYDQLSSALAEFLEVVPASLEADQPWSDTPLGVPFKLIESGQRRWRMVNAPHLVALVRAWAAFVNGKLVERPEDEAAGEAPPEAA
jgi:hypothetical protein